ncbi:hypothetical protein DID78_00215 [Candidatus Marinamargulisbacteria bacterium SCGC AG-343-D04]|nr:hypothetical protein DID78_00215 [Candidatus Marinamargulisbacteria bacterium SCGC AG-343-D04]
MNVKLYSLLLFILTFTFHVQGLENSIELADAGLSADSIGSGGILAGVSGSVAVFDNPAKMGNGYDYSGSVFQTTLLNDVNINNFSISKVLGKSTVGFGYIGNRESGIAETKELNGSGEFATKGYYNSTMERYYVGYQYQTTEKVSFGVTLKSFKSKMYGVSGNGMNADLGFYYKGERFNLGVSAANVLVWNKTEFSNGGKESHGVVLAATVSKDYGSLEPMAQMKHYGDKKSLYAVGCKVSHPSLKRLDFMFGARGVHYLDSVKVRSTVGMNLNLNEWTISYAYEKSDSAVVDNETYFSIQYKK